MLGGELHNPGHPSRPNRHRTVIAGNLVGLDAWLYSRLYITVLGKEHPKPRQVRLLAQFRGFDPHTETMASSTPKVSQKAESVDKFFSSSLFCG